MNTILVTAPVAGPSLFLLYACAIPVVLMCIAIANEVSLAALRTPGWDR